MLSALLSAATAAARRSSPLTFLPGTLTVAWKAYRLMHPAAKPRTRISNGKLAVGITIGVAALGLAPVYHLMTHQTVPGDRELPPHMSMRGAYINSGSKDAGPDNDLPGTTAAYNKQQQQQQQR